MAGGHEQPIAMFAAEAQVRTKFRQLDLRNPLTFHVEHVHAIVAITNPASAGPDIAVFVAADAVSKTLLFLTGNLHFH